MHVSVTVAFPELSRYLKKLKWKLKDGAFVSPSVPEVLHFDGRKDSIREHKIKFGTKPQQAYYSLSQCPKKANQIRRQISILMNTSASIVSRPATIPPATSPLPVTVPAVASLRRPFRRISGMTGGNNGLKITNACVMAGVSLIWTNVMTKKMI